MLSMRSSFLRHAALASLTLLTTMSSANAAITGVTGSAVQIAAPASALQLALPGPPAFCWDEQQNVVIPASGLLVNTLGNGFWTGPSGNTNFYFGGPVDSHIIHFDASQGVSNVGGQVTFSGNIVAVIYENILLDATDLSLGAIGTTYDTGNPLRSNTTNSLFQSAYQVNNNVLDFSLWASVLGLPNRMTELRVLTAAVPAPGAVALLGLAGLVGSRRRK
ncbi:MAG: hypothetical protein ACKO3W_13980 [bacterium]